VKNDLIRQNIGGIDNEESSIGISNYERVYYVGISCAAAIELPLRVEVNGERVYFPDEQPFIDSNGGPRYRRDL